MENKDDPNGLCQRLEQTLIEKYGAMVGGADLAHLIGYRSADTLRKAVANDALTLKTFWVPGRQGRFALTVEVADWLMSMRQQQSATDSNNRKSIQARSNDGHS